MMAIAVKDNQKPAEITVSGSRAKITIKYKAKIWEGDVGRLSKNNNMTKELSISTLD